MPWRAAVRSRAGPASMIRMRLRSMPRSSWIRCRIRRRTTRDGSSHIWRKWDSFARCGSQSLPVSVVSVRHAFEFGASRILAPLGYELRDRILSERPEGFAGYLEAACQVGMDVNDYEEQRLGWRLPLPTLEELVLPLLRPDSRVCEIGPGTGRWSRHIINCIPDGELHL